MKKLKVALQMFSVRKNMEISVEDTLKKVKEAGYDYIELAGLFNYTIEEMIQLLDKYELTCISAHQGYDSFINEGKSALDYLKKLGVKYCALPGVNVRQHKGTSDFPMMIDKIERMSKALSESNITLLYHNHYNEFNKYEGKFLLDWLYDTLPKNVLQAEIDTGWVHFAGINPAEYIRKYKGRTAIVHLKDFICKHFGERQIYNLVDENNRLSIEESGFEHRFLGSGVQDFESIINACIYSEVEYIVVEQDAFVDIEPLEAVEKSREYLKTLGY